jgi:hypothetical protein
LTDAVGDNRAALVARVKFRRSHRAMGETGLRIRPHSAPPVYYFLLAALLTFATCCFAFATAC